MFLANLLNEITDLLHASHGSVARSYAERILQHTLSCDRVKLYTGGNWEISGELYGHCRKIAERCSCGEPLEYILGVAYFYNREFVVTPSVLIPRPDSEVLVETVLSREPRRPAVFADLGTGSGILSCILTEECSEWYAAAIDCSPEALDVTVKNRRSSRVMPVCIDRFTALKRKRLFDFIISNPPYISSMQIPSLDRSVKEFEPRGALDGGRDGLDFYRYFASEALWYLKPGGALYCEIGFDQGETVPDLFPHTRWKGHEIIHDISGNSRVFSAIAIQDGMI